MLTHHRVVFGDSRKMAELADESVHLVVTSPPYWQLKDYGNPEQIGYDDSYEGYINNLNIVWNECFRVLMPGCRMCINIGDQFARSVYYGRYKIIPIRTEIIRFCETVGFDYMGAIIWQKVTTCNTTGGATVMGSYPYPRNGAVKLDYEFVLIFKKRGKAPKADPDSKKRSKLTREEWNQYFSGHWQFAGVKQKDHLAMFPEELPTRLIKMFSFVGEVVLDPFLGSGTTMLAARNLDRSSIGYEINEEFLRLISEKLGSTGVQILKSDSTAGSVSDLLAGLPYLFEDPTGLSRKTDPKERRFDSKIDGEESARERYFTVKRILSPDRIVLDGGLQVSLIGIVENPEKREAAMDFLSQMTKGQRVYVRGEGDEPLDDGEAAPDSLRGYIFLKNRTPINAHLVKQGLVFVDKESDYREKERFMALAQSIVS